MEGTQPNAKRKRRSSILKSQRAPRTPFSELEFNVATPTESVKSRRVSFSRRTGVAEFATNEATTTWKSVYEEQNRSLESSGQQSSGQSSGPGRTSIQHLGSRIFDRQFQDVEAEIDFSPFEDAPNGPQGPFNQSLHLNVTEQLALLETTADGRKLTAPSQHFELSEFTEQGRLFKDELTNPTNNELSNIQINFSTLQAVTNNDDLDAIERDLECSQNNYVGCQGPSKGFSNSADMSQYIEFDLNATQGLIQNANDSDMSITDTIRSPRKELSNVDIPGPVATWVDNKENIVVNPYVTPDEGNNFAIPVSPEKVLVFDGKKLKYAAMDDDLDDLEDPKRGANKSLGSKSLESNQSKKVIYADLNSAEGSETHLDINSASNKTLVFNASGDISVDLSMTGVVNVANMTGQTKIFGLDDGDVSATKCASNTKSLDKQVDQVVTQALTNMLKESFEGFSESNTYVQQALTDLVETEAKSFHSNEKHKRQTIVYKENEGDISLTACVPNEVLSKLSNKTGASFDMSMTKVVSSDVLTSLSSANAEFEEVEISSVDMSMTKAVSNDIMKTLAGQKPSELDASTNMSMTRALPNQILAILGTDNKNTGEIYVPSANMSVTKAVSSSIISSLLTMDTKSDTMEISDINMSLTRAVPQRIIDNLLTEKQVPERENLTLHFETSTVKPVAMDISDMNMSMTKALPGSHLADFVSDCQIPEMETTKLNTTDFNMSMTKAVPNHIISNLASQNLPDETEPLVSTNRRRKTILFQDADVSMTEAIPTNLLEEVKHQPLVSNTSMASSAAVELVSFVQSNRKAVDILEKKPTHAKSVLTDESIKVRKHIVFEDASDQTLDVSGNFTNILHGKSSPEGSLLGKSTKTLESPIKTSASRVESKTPEPRKSPNKSLARSSRYSAGKRANSSRSTSPERDNKLLNLEKMGEKKRRSYSPDAHIHMARYTAARKSRVSPENRSMNPFGNPNKATSPERTLSSPKKPVKPYQILNKATSPDKRKLDTGMNQANREVIVYQTSSPGNTRERSSRTSSFRETSPPTSSVESMTTSSENHISTKSASSYTSGTQETTVNVDRTSHFYNQATVLQSEVSQESAPKQNAPSSKGDEFQKSSQKLNFSLPAISKLENPQLERRKTMPSKAESKLEEPINTIAYDQLDSISKKSIKTPQAAIERGCQPETASTTPELLSETTSFHPSEITSVSKDESLTAIATTIDTFCDPIQEYVVDPPRAVFTVPVNVTEDIGLDPPSEQLASYANHPVVHENTVTDTGTQITPSGHFSDDGESVITAHTVPQSSTSNESCKTLTDSIEMTSEEEPHKPSETSTKTLLNNLLDMSDISFPTCAGVNQSGLKTHMVPEKVNRTVCCGTGSPYQHDSSFATKNRRQTARHSPADTRKKITFCDNAEQLNYEPTDTDTSNGPSSAKRSPILSKYFSPNRSADDSDASTVNGDRKSKLLDIISVLTRPDPDALTATTSSESRPGPAKRLAFNLCDTDDTSHVSIVQDGKIVHDSDSTETDVTLRRPVYSSSDYSNCKVNVIPSRYYDDVAENVNDLMKDLVKPRSDGYPFEDTPFQKPRKSPSICSTQVQATMAASSQVDLETLPYDSVYERPQVCRDSNAAHGKQLKSIIKPVASGEVLSNPEEYDTVTLKLQKHRCETNNDRVLVFDKNNPLNNVMIAPIIDLTEAHEYNPDSDVDTSDTEPNQMAVNSVKIEPKSPASDTKDDLNNSVIEVKDTEVNTVLAMKGTKELLDANSSLTLVDEPIVRRFTDTDLVSPKRKRMQVLFRNNDPDTENLERSFLGRLAQKIPGKLHPSSPPQPKSPSKSPRSATITVPKCRKPHGSHKNRKRHRSPVTVQQLMAQSGAPGDSKQLLLQDNMSLSTSGSDVEQSMAKSSMEVISSFTNSHRGPIKYNESLDSKRLRSSTSDWLPELVNEMSSKNLLSECDSGVNVVAQIDMLPFMGSRECEWEPSGSDTWAFRLLQGRLRLELRLAHRLDNSTRRLVRADTPVKAVRLEPTHPEQRNTVASLCIRYAAEAMLVVIARGCARAGAAPALLRRCAAIARVALRWGTAMHEARYRLAFTMQDNIIALKVANIPLRSVWEVTFRVDTATAGAPDAPWPAAADVRVTPVVSDWDITPEDVERALAGINRDWGHVPKTIWKIFRFLKSKTRDDDVLQYVH